MRVTTEQNKFVIALRQLCLKHQVTLSTEGSMIHAKQLKIIKASADSVWIVPHTPDDPIQVLKGGG